jgi:hypothetical protein
MGVPIPWDDLPHFAAVAGTLTEQILFAARSHCLYQSGITVGVCSANLGGRVAFVRLVYLGIPNVEVTLVRRAFHRVAEANGVERADCMLTPRAEMRDVVSHCPATLLGRRRVVAQRKERGLLDARSLERLYQAFSQRVVGHAGSITASAGATLHGPAIST